jgi:hypothetical protein
MKSGNQSRRYGRTCAAGGEADSLWVAVDIEVDRKERGFDFSLIQATSTLRELK